MIPSQSHSNDHDGPLLSPREEAERFAVAAERFLERARQNPELATQLLRDIGYFEMMEQQREEEAAAANGAQTNGSWDGAEISHASQP